MSDINELLSQVDKQLLLRLLDSLINESQKDESYKDESQKQNEEK